MPDIVLVYVTKSGNSGLVAEAIADGAREMDFDVRTVSLCDIGEVEVYGPDVIAFGSPTYEHKMLPSIEKFLNNLDRARCTGKLGIAFGSYGWSGEAPVQIAKKMRELGFEVLDPVMRVQYKPMEKDIEACRLLGKGIALKLKSLKRKNI